MNFRDPSLPSFITKIQNLKHITLFIGFQPQDHIATNYWLFYFQIFESRFSYTYNEKQKNGSYELNNYIYCSILHISLLFQPCIVIIFEVSSFGKLELHALKIFFDSKIAK